MEKPEKIRRILLVDDDESLRVVVGEILKSNGYSVDEAADCATALGMLRRSSFDLIILDITLPDGSGLDILQVVGSDYILTKVIVITGSMGLEIALRSLRLGARDYITKPYTFNYLLRSIEHALNS